MNINNAQRRQLMAGGVVHSTGIKPGKINAWPQVCERFFRPFGLRRKMLELFTQIRLIIRNAS